MNSGQCHLFSQIQQQQLPQCCFCCCSLKSNFLWNIFFFYFFFSRTPFGCSKDFHSFQNLLPILCFCFNFFLKNLICNEFYKPQLFSDLLNYSLKATSWHDQDHYNL